MDGIQVMQHLNASGTRPAIPVIAFSASVVGEEASSFRELTDDFLAKPITRNDLVAVLQKYLPYDDVREESEGASKPGKAVTSQSTPILVTEPGLRELLTSMKDEWQELTYRQTVNDMEAFGLKVAELGEQHSHTGLQQWGRAIRDAAYQFDLETLNRLFDQFPSFTDA